MVVMTNAPTPDVQAQPTKINPPRPRKGVPRAVSWTVVVLAALGALVPLVLSGAYGVIRNDGSFTLDGFAPIVEGDPALLRALGLTFAIAVCTVVVTLAVLTPLLIAVHVWAPRWKPVVETVCTLPLVIPSIALVAGLIAVLRWGAQQGRGTFANTLSQAVQNPNLPFVLVGTYTILCLPFVYRALDAGLRTLPIKTYFEASASLGGGRIRTLLKIVLPNLRNPLLYSGLFAASLAFGEFTVAATLSQQTLPVWLFTTSSQDFRASITLSLVTTLLTWALLIAASLLASAQLSRTQPSRTPPDEPTTTEGESL